MVARAGVDQPRQEGAVDHPGADWVAASGANYRRADRPYDYVVDRVVIHVVQGSYEDALKVFRDPGHRAAAHYVVRRDGHIAQTVRELDVAFHAGNRSYNERSVGIEHEGFVTRPQDFTDAMYPVLGPADRGDLRALRDGEGPRAHRGPLGGAGHRPHRPRPPLGLGPLSGAGAGGADREVSRRPDSLAQAVPKTTASGRPLPSVEGLLAVSLPM